MKHIPNISKSSMYEINTLHYPNPFFFSHIFFTLNDERDRERRVRINALQRIGPRRLTHSYSTTLTKPRCGITHRDDSTKINTQILKIRVVIGLVLTL